MEHLVSAWRIAYIVRVSVYGWYPHVGRGNAGPQCPPGVMLVEQPHETTSGPSDPTQVPAWICGAGARPQKPGVAYMLVNGHLCLNVIPWVPCGGI